MKKTLVLVSALSIFAGGCGTLEMAKCFQYRENFTQIKYDNIKQIAIEQAMLNGYQNYPNENKPSKYNDWKGSLVFNQNTSTANGSLTVSFRKDIICYSGSGFGDANPKPAIAAMIEKMDILESKK